MRPSAIAILSFLLLALATPVLAAPDTRTELPTERPLRVLFVGNSYTFFNNLPAVFVEAARFARPGLPAPEVEMVAAGGATLDDLLTLPRWEGALGRGPWDVVVLQERGGVLACLTTLQRPLPTDCATSVSAHRKMTKASRAAGATRVLLFGTWQMGTREPGAASRGTRKLGSMLDLPVVDLGAMLFAAERADPGPWFTGDDHPHRLGTLLIAFALWQAMSGDAVPPRDFEATVPEYTGHRGRRARQGGDGAPTYVLRASAAQMAVIAAAIARR
jgi:hypothetical protein